LFCLPTISTVQYALESLSRPMRALSPPRIAPPPPSNRASTLALPLHSSRRLLPPSSARAGAGPRRSRLPSHPNVSVMRRSLHRRRCRGVDLSRTPAISIPAPSPLPHACSSDLGSRDSPLARPPLVCLVPDFSDRVLRRSTSPSSSVTASTSCVAPPHVPHHHWISTNAGPGSLVRHPRQRIQAWAPRHHRTSTSTTSRGHMESNCFDLSVPSAQIPGFHSIS
jgi:hypothetical protein